MTRSALTFVLLAAGLASPSLAQPATPPAQAKPPAKTAPAKKAAPAIPAAFTAAKDAGIDEPWLKEWWLHIPQSRQVIHEVRWPQ